MPDRPFPNEARAALNEVAARFHVETRDADVVHQHSNIAIALPSARLLVRIASNPEALDGVAASLAVTRWLSGRGFPCVAPVDLDQPFVVVGRVVSVWQLLDTADEPGTGDELGRLLRTLHDQPVPPFHLSDLSDPLASVAKAVGRTAGAMSDQDREWLLERIDELRRQWDGLEFRHVAGLIHGDAHPNNLIRARDGTVILGDWDHVAIGPREWDLIQSHYMRRRFDRPADDDIEQFTEAYGWDVRDWAGFETLVNVREVSGLSSYIRRAPTEQAKRAEVAYRVETLRARDIGARWNSPSGR